MSEQIDWSKAPEGTTGHGNIGIGHFYVWFSDKWYEYVNSNHGGRYYFGDAGVYKMDDISCVTYRQTTPSWSGEGLPPAGVVCEYQRNDVSYRQTFVKVTVKYISLSLVVLEHFAGKNEFVESRDSCVFRPIRTPEQIAADEREASIKEMTANYAKNSDMLAGWAAYVYDTLGYRKP